MKKRMALFPTLRLYLLILVVFLAIDLTWLGLLARSFYRAQLGDFLAPRTNWLAAGVFYLIFTAGLMVFVVLPNLQGGSTGSILFYGAFFGLVTYAAYDLTNLATLKDWPLLLVLVDMAWGTVLSSITSWVGFMAARWMG
jgi:uncharacterized membrane protein